MEIILDDVSMLIDDIKKLIKRKIYNKFCSQCHLWLFKKEFILDENNRCFCSEECLESNKRIWDATKKLIDNLCNEILTKSLSDSGQFVNIKYK